MLLGDATDTVVHSGLQYLASPNSITTSHVCSKCQWTEAAFCSTFGMTWKLERTAWSHAAPLLHRLHWLPVRKRITYKLCVLMFDVYHGTAPEYLTNLCSRSSVRGDFVVRRTRTRLANSSFTVAGPAAWNLLPVSIRNTNSHAAFRRQLKTYLFSTPDWLPYLCSLHCVYSVVCEALLSTGWVSCCDDDDDDDDDDERSVVDSAITSGAWVCKLVCG